MFDQFTQLVADASVWTFAVVFLLAAFDALIPIVPSETVLVTAGVVAASHDISLLPLAVALGAAGAFAGDNLAYLIGARYGAHATRRFAQSDNSHRRLEWAKHQLELRGPVLITAGRFIPGGRTAVTLTAGLTRFPWARFATYDAIASLLWATYAGTLGYFGGNAFEESWKGLLLALGIAAVVTLGIELSRRLLSRYRSRYHLSVALRTERCDWTATGATPAQPSVRARDWSRESLRATEPAAGSASRAR